MTGDNISDSSGDELLELTKSTEPRISERGFRVRWISDESKLLVAEKGEKKIESGRNRVKTHENGEFRKQTIRVHVGGKGASDE